MKQSSMTSLRAKYALAILLSITTVYALPQAQTTAKKPLSIDDYTKWRSITGQELSSDGKWVTYVLQLTNVPTTETKPVLHLLNLETNVDVAVPDARPVSSRRTPSGSPTRSRPRRRAVAAAARVPPVRQRPARHPRRHRRRRR